MIKGNTRQSLYLISSIFLLCTSCTTSRESLLKKTVFYTKEINQNYLKFGQCIDGSFASRINYIRTPVYTPFPGGIIVKNHTSTQTGIESYIDKKNKSYYIYDYVMGGLINIKNWIIVIKGSRNNQKSAVELRSKKTLLGKTRFNVDAMDKMVKQCLVNQGK